MLHEVHVGAQPLDRYAEILGPEAMESVQLTAARLAARLARRVMWNINSTATGGGVAEILSSLLPYARGAGIDARWIVIEADAEFFRITKRLHHALHGSTGDGSELGPDEQHHYEEVLAKNGIELAGLVRSGDIVIAHDPQTAALIPFLVRRGAAVIWRCHIGHERPNDEARRGWAFIEPFIKEANAYVFSHAGYAPPFLDRQRTFVVHPTVDVFSPKNQALSPESVRSILVRVGLIEGPDGEEHSTFLREDGSPGRVDRSADVVRLGRASSWDTPIVTQVSRWDTLKDPVGVLESFARLLRPDAPRNAELILAGPNVRAVADDPEGAVVLDQVVDAWRSLPHAQRRRIHLASLPMVDIEENAIIVNALQRHAEVVVQKSLQEGFGLTVTEAMWKARPIVASAVGGINEQIRDEVDGLLISDPTDYDATARAIERLLGDRPFAERLGESARQRVKEKFIGIRALLRYAEIVEPLGGEVEPELREPAAQSGAGSRAARGPARA